MSSVHPAPLVALAVFQLRGGCVSVRRCAAVIRRFADDLLREYASAKREGRGTVVFIVPVGPVGQYDLWAERCNRERISLRNLVLINEEI